MKPQEISFFQRSVSHAKILKRMIVFGKIYGIMCMAILSENVDKNLYVDKILILFN